MKNIFKSIRKKWRYAAWATSIISIFILMSISSGHQSRHHLHSLIVRIDTSNHEHFLADSDIVKQLHDGGFYGLENFESGRLNLRNLEHLILSNPYVHSAEVFLDMNDNLHVDVKQVRPIIRIINTSGVSYYLDEYAVAVPPSNNFTARVPVATGWIAEDLTNSGTADAGIPKQIFQLAKIIDADSLLKPLIEQVAVSASGNFELVTKIGDHVVQLGDSSGMKEKLEKLIAFYSNPVAQRSLNRYSVINLEYRDEVYCTLNDTRIQPIKSDSSKHH